ncbi:hypothetical protein [Psychrobacillus psychrodurans]|nr:hypothetical protein [Psychrobacillus psychrodurans]
MQTKQSIQINVPVHGHSEFTDDNAPSISEKDMKKTQCVLLN